MPELPEAMRKRFMEEYGLSEYDAGVLTADRDTAVCFEAASQTLVNEGFPKKDIGKELCHMITVDLRGVLNKSNVQFVPAGTTWVQKAPELGRLFAMKLQNVISGSIAKTVLEEMVATGQSAEEIVFRLLYTLAIHLGGDNFCDADFVTLYSKSATKIVASAIAPGAFF